MEQIKLERDFNSYWLRTGRDFFFFFLGLEHKLPGSEVVPREVHLHGYPSPLPMSVPCVLCQPQQALVLASHPMPRVFANSPMCICSVWFKRLTPIFRHLPVPCTYTQRQSLHWIATATLHLVGAEKFQMLTRSPQE